jgi:enoyl-CoA hydratase/carnithine racemase
MRYLQVWTNQQPADELDEAPMAGDLLQIIGKAESDHATRAIIITGGVEGKLITHYSVDELAAMAADPAQCARWFPEMEAGFHRMLNRLMLMPKAVIAAINGDCMGGGYELALACDLRRRTARSGLDCRRRRWESRRRRHAALAAADRAGEGARGTVVRQRLQSARSRADGDGQPGDRARDANGVCDVVGADAGQERPPRPIAAIKRAVHLGADHDLESALYVERCEMRDVMTSEDARIFMNAYNAEVAKDPMAARSNFLNGFGIPAANAKGQ